MRADPFDSPRSWRRIIQFNFFLPRTLIGHVGIHANGLFVGDRPVFQMSVVCVRCKSLIEIDSLFGFKGNQLLSGVGVNGFFFNAIDAFKCSSDRARTSASRHVGNVERYELKIASCCGRRVACLFGFIGTGGRRTFGRAGTGFGSRFTAAGENQAGRHEEAEHEILL